MARFTCSGSERLPKGQPVMVEGRKVLSGVCSVCGSVLKVRADGHVVVHRGVEAWENA